MKVLVVGAAGMLGQAVVDEFADDHELFQTTRLGDDEAYALDVADAKAVRGVVLRTSPELIINCSAYTAVDDCETNMEQAYAVNAIGPRNLALAATSIGAKLFHVSTDYVFDGEKDSPYIEYDRPNPRSIYGKSKLAGEDEVMRHSGQFYIGRVQWLYGPGGKNFADTILKLGESRDSLNVVDDQHGAPTYTVDVARQMRILVEEGEPGLYHMSAQGATTWYGFTKALYEAAGRPDFPISPCKTVDFPRPAPRPANSTLRNFNLELTLGDSMRPWKDAIADYLRRREA